MTVSTDGQICYGIRFEEGYEFPWDSDEWDEDIKTWWLYEVCGYQNPFELYDEKGNWPGGVKPPMEKTREYYDARFAFEKEHPVPVELVNYCSCDFPMYILAVPSSTAQAMRGHPEEIGALTVAETDRESLIAFCNDYDIEIDEEPKWWLSSLWC